ncbi:WecB/TagA/CpsF family glycosyltransferase [Oricola cellulosilytica]|uniref:Glycosyltransferase n=1 Tax=Oricola cellulosilytica TaxID=1429082 RepID=A0A4R0PJL7_9HYPH|nr:WecB/TagA/CpsF family glycosyltransferase [Oricola cellulosilytica]TCD16570.1 glycosyltransferase [Oricola cellulosilytica]
MLQTVTVNEEGPAREIVGVEVRDFTREEALDFVHERIAASRYTPITFLNAHNANVAETDPAFREALDGFTVLSDGIGVDIAARILHGQRFRANLNGTDFVPDLLRAAPDRLRVGLFGGKPGVAARAATRFHEIAPRHEYRVLQHGYVDPIQEAEVLNALEAWRPDILLVALGVPKQELWIAQRIDERHCIVPLGIGALFDLVTGTVPRAPRWIRAIRMEWMYRLTREPGRLWKRYLVGNPVFLARVLRQKMVGKTGQSHA